MFIFAARKPRLSERRAEKIRAIPSVSGFERSSNVKYDTNMEARTTMYPQEGQLLVSISDMSMIKDIKKAIGMLKGVGNVTVPRRKRISAYERSLQELEEGRVYEAKDVDDLFKQCLG
jgi:hypothetical protein